MEHRAVLVVLGEVVEVVFLRVIGVFREINLLHGIGKLTALVLDLRGGAAVDRNCAVFNGPLPL